MRQSRFTVEEIIRIIAESELPTSSIAGTARKYGIKEATLYRWRAKYKGMGKSEAQRLKVLEDENRQLKRLVADKELIIQTFDSRPKAAGDPGAAATRPLPAAGAGPAADGQGHLLPARPGTSAGGWTERADSGTGPRPGLFWLSAHHRSAPAARLAGQPQAGVSPVSANGTAKTSEQKRAAGAEAAGAL